MRRASPRLGDEARGARRLGVFGGSFDPPHEGHLFVARAAREERGLDHVLWVPAARPPHKPDRVLAADAQRAHMLELLLADEPACSIWTVEFAREGPSYTIDTLHALRAELPEVELFLLLGTDNLPGFPRWHRAREILALVTPVVVPRAGAPADPEELAALPEAERRALAEAVLDRPPVEVSSTELRARLAAGADHERVPPALREYLAQSGIYRDR